MCWIFDQNWLEMGGLDGKGYLRIPPPHLSRLDFSRKRLPAAAERRPPPPDSLFFVARALQGDSLVLEAGEGVLERPLI